MVRMVSFLAGALALAILAMGAGAAQAQEGIYTARQTNWVAMTHDTCMTRAARAVNSASQSFNLGVPFANEESWLVGGNSPQAGVYIACYSDNDSLQLDSEFAERVLVSMTVSSEDGQLANDVRDNMRDCFFSDECGTVSESAMAIFEERRRNPAIAQDNTRFTLNARASRGTGEDAAAELESDIAAVLDEPDATTIGWTTHAVAYQENLGSEYRFTCPPLGEAEPGRVWGTIIYTTDSAVCAAAVHAGFLTREGGEVKIQILDGRRSYDGSESNGITSQDYGQWNASYEFILEDE